MSNNKSTISLNELQERYSLESLSGDNDPENSEEEAAVIAELAYRLYFTFPLNGNYSDYLLDVEEQRYKGYERGIALLNVPECWLDWEFYSTNQTLDQIDVLTSSDKELYPAHKHNKIEYVGSVDVYESIWSTLKGLCEAGLPVTFTDRQTGESWLVIV